MILLFSLPLNVSVLPLANCSDDVFKIKDENSTKKSSSFLLPTQYHHKQHQIHNYTTCVCKVSVKMTLKQKLVLGPIAPCLAYRMSILQPNLWSIGQFEQMDEIFKVVKSYCEIK